MNCVDPFGDKPTMQVTFVIHSYTQFINTEILHGIGPSPDQSGVLPNTTGYVFMIAEGKVYRSSHAITLL